MNRKIFITGAAGFIGFHLAKHLHRMGCSVIGYDNFNPYYSPALKRARAAELAKVGIGVIEGDICDAITLQDAVAQYKPSHLVHLAAQAGVRHSLKQPHEYLRTNIDGFLNILEICRHHLEIKLSYASSSSVYGHNRTVPFATNDRTDNQASLYGVTKKCNELMATTYHNLFGISAIGLRFFTVYGPWGRPDMAYYSFAQAINDGIPIDLYNHGEMERDFTYIDDIVDGIAATLNLPPQAAIFNLGNNQPESLQKFVALLEKHLDKSAVCRFLPMQAGDVHTTYADISSSNQQLNFYPKISLDEGLRRFVEWFQQYRHKM
jgi:UDP-glucuronate 4-epimerase